jgi:hypothetical protein
MPERLQGGTSVALGAEVRQFQAHPVSDDVGSHHDFVETALMFPNVHVTTVPRQLLLAVVKRTLMPLSGQLSVSRRNQSAHDLEHVDVTPTSAPAAPRVGRLTPQPSQHSNRIGMSCSSRTSVHEVLYLKAIRDPAPQESAVSGGVDQPIWRLAHRHAGADHEG